MTKLGTVTRESGDGWNRGRMVWEIRAEPHVLMRLKRVFGQVLQAAGGVRVVDTPSVCVDLRWFLDRYPMDMTEPDRAWLERQATGEVERVAMVREVLDGSIPPRELRTALALRSYQASAVELVLRSRGLLVGDELGVGKTAIGIGLISLPEARPAVVVTVTYLPAQWKAELERFLPGIRVHIARSGKPYDLLGTDRGRKARAWRLPGTDTERAAWPDVVVISYSKLAGWADALSKVSKSVVFDEIHELRGGVERQGKPIAKGVSASVLADACDFRLGLTGTPVFNYGNEMRNLLELLQRGALGTEQEFEREWCTGSIVRSPAAFGTYLRSAGLYIRRTRSDVGRELPGLTIVPMQLDMVEDPLKAIRGVAADLARRILARETEKGERWRASGELDWQLRQATGIAKAPAVAAFVQLLVEQGEQVLLAGWHKAVYGLWKTAFGKAQIKYAMFTGDESPEAKVAAAKAFEADQVQVLVMSLRSGAGLDGLQRGKCRTVVVGELDWSPQVHRQLIGRLHRDGQDKPVTAYYLMSDTGSDPVIVDVLGLKRQQAAGIEDPTNTDVAPVADRQRAKALARAYLASIGEVVADDEVVGDDVWEDVPVPPVVRETVRKPTLVLTPG